MTLRELRAVAREWQDRLGLNEWKITVRYPTKGEMDPDAYDGHAYWQPEYPEGLIVVSRGTTAHTIVHELLHIRLEGHRPAPAKYDPLYERALNQLTAALLGEPEP